jgi:hypothetical protein
MARRVFFSFHFDNDFWRTQQVRNMGVLEGQSLCSPNQWEEVKRKGDNSIKKWVDDNLAGKSCLIVLVGSETANRPWVQHEICRAWDERKGVLGIRVDKLLDTTGRPSAPGPNPFDRINFGNPARKLSSTAKLITPNGFDSKAAYASIATGIESWIEDAISIRLRN